jgi:hypothetical protein
MNEEYSKSAEIKIDWKGFPISELESININFEGKHPFKIMENLSQFVYDTKLGYINQISYSFDELDNNKTYYTEEEFIQKFNSYLS